MKLSLHENYLSIYYTTRSMSSISSEAHKETNLKSGHTDDPMDNIG